MPLPNKTMPYVQPNQPVPFVQQTPQLPQQRVPTGPQLQVGAPPGVQYTGAGPNGVVEPSRPVEMVQTSQGPRMIHEGEYKIPNPDGSVTVMPNQQPMAPQQVLEKIERRFAIPGFQAGGVYDPNKPTPPVPATPAAPPTQPMPPAPVAPQIQPVQPVTMQQPPAQPGLNQQVLEAGQQKVLQGWDPRTQQMTSGLTQQMLADPTAGYDPRQNIQPTLDLDARLRSQYLERLRRETAPLSHTGQRLDQLIDVGLRSAQDRAVLEDQLRRSAATDYNAAVAEALEQGRKTAETERARFATDVGAIADIRAAAEGERAQMFNEASKAVDRGLQIAMANQSAELQTMLMGYQGQIQRGLMLTEQEYTSLENELAREHALALQRNDAQTAKEIETLRGEIATQRDAATFRHQQDLERMRIEQDQWAIGRQEELTKLGWSVEDARALADRELSQWTTEYNASVEKYLQAGAQQYEAEQLASEQAWRAGQANLDRQLNREVEAGRITMAEKELAARVDEFDSELDFRRWAATMGFDDAAAQRAWQSGENALMVAHEQQMAYLKQEFAREGVSWDMIINQIATGAMDGTQAANFINEQAAKYGIEIPPMTAEEQAKSDIGGLNDRWQAEGLKDFTAGDYKAVEEAYKAGVDVPFLVSDNTIESMDLTRLVDVKRPGSQRWILNDQAKNWLDQNRGKLYRASDGRIYEVVGTWQAPSKEDYASTEGISFRDVQTGEIKVLKNETNQDDSLMTKRGEQQNPFRTTR